MIEALYYEAANRRPSYFLGCADLSALWPPSFSEIVCDDQKRLVVSFGPMQRIVSFLPSATEMVCALGLADRLVGITHECDYPAEIVSKPIVVQCALRLEGMNPMEIDTAVRAHIHSGASLYQVDERLLRELAPTLIL